VNVLLCVYVYVNKMVWKKLVGCNGVIMGFEQGSLKYKRRGQCNVLEL
jgi:hypothetical protein